MHKKRNRKNPDYRGIALKLYNERYNPNHPQTKALGDVLEAGTKFIDDKVFGDTKIGNTIEEFTGTVGNVIQGIYAPTADAWAGAAADFSGLVADTSALITGDQFEVDPVTGEQILDDQGNPIPKISGVEKIARNAEAGGESVQGFLGGNWQKGVSSGAEFVDRTVENVTDFEGKKDPTELQKGITTGRNIINTGLEAYNQFENMQGQVNKFKEDLNAGENIETARRGGNVQDRLNRMRSYLGGHKVRPQQFANGDGVRDAQGNPIAGDPPIITDKMLKQMIIEWEKGTQTGYHPSQLPRTQREFDALDPKMKTIIVGQYPDIKYLIHEGQPTREEMMRLYGPGGGETGAGGYNFQQGNAQSGVIQPLPNTDQGGMNNPQFNNPQFNQDLINAQRGNTGIVLPPTGAAPMARGTRVRSYDEGDHVHPHVDPNLQSEIGRTTGQSGGVGKTRLVNPLKTGIEGSDISSVITGQTSGTPFLQTIGTGLGNLPSNFGSMLGINKGIPRFPGSQVGDMNLSLGSQASFMRSPQYNKHFLTGNVESGLGINLPNRAYPVSSGNEGMTASEIFNPYLQGSLGYQYGNKFGLRGRMSSYNSPNAFEGMPGFSGEAYYNAPNNWRLSSQFQPGDFRLGVSKTFKGGGSVPRPYEQGAEVQVDPSLQGISGDDLTMINRQSGEVVRRNYPGTTDHDVKNYYQYTGTSHSNVRPGMPNGGNDVKEQVGAFIFPKKHAKSISKIVRDRKYFQDIINKSKSV